MNLLVANLLAILRSHPIIRDLRIVTLDETPSGRLELKVRCRLAPVAVSDADIAARLCHNESVGTVACGRSSTIDPVSRGHNQRPESREVKPCR